MRFGTILAIDAAALLTMPAAAQLKPRVVTGSHIPVDPKSVEQNRAGPIRKAFAQSIFRHDRKLSERYLRNSDPIEVDLAAAGVPGKTLNTRFGMERCLGREAMDGDLGLRMSASLVRSYLAEESYLATVKSTPARLAADAKAPERNFVASAPSLSRARAMGELADCIVRSEPAGSDTLLRTVPGSIAEGRAARALGPAIGPCLYADQKFTLTVLTIRAIVADGAWQVYARETSALAAR